MIQVLLGFDGEERLTSIAWLQDGSVRYRVLTPDQTYFERASSSRTLTHLWSRETLYQGYRPALVENLTEAFKLFGKSHDEVEDLPMGDLPVPTHPILGAHR